jgi:hypothetical protein
MNVTQMHLAIQQGVDKINSLQADMLLSEEIDIELNKSQIRFINTKYGKNNKYREGFEQSQKRIDDIRTLVREFEAPVTFKEQYSSEYWIDTFRLPTDYMYLVNQRSLVWTNNCKPLTWNIQYTDPIDYFTFDMNMFVANNNQGFISTITLLENAAGSTNGQTFGVAFFAFITGFSYPSDITAVKDYIISLGNTIPGFEIYWEQHGPLNHPGQFILVVDSAVHSWFNWDASLGVVSTLVGSDTNGNIFSTALPIHYEENTNSKRVATNAVERQPAINRFSQQDDIFKLLQDPFNTTKHTSPLSTIRGNFIDVYASAIFIIDTVKITYVRNPTLISLSLGVSCELPDHSHQEIVDMTVSSILEGISDPRFKTHQIEVGKNE